MMESYIKIIERGKDSIYSALYTSPLDNKLELASRGSEDNNELQQKIEVYSQENAELNQQLLTQQSQIQRLMQEVEQLKKGGYKTDFFALNKKPLGDVDGATSVYLNTTKILSGEDSSSDSELTASL